MKKIKEIYDIVYNNCEYKNPDAFVQIVEPISKDLIEFDFELETYEKAKRLISDYALNKSTLGSDKVALPYLIKAIELQTNNLNHLELNPINKELVYHAGIISFKQKNYRNSLRYLKILAESFPHKSEFINGYNTSLRKIINTIDYTFLTGVVIFLLLDFIFKIKTDFTLYGLIVSLAGTLLINGYYQFKKKKTLHNNV